MSSLARWIILIIILLVAGIAYAFLSFFELVEKEVDLGYSSKANRNPLLAAEIFLRKQGLVVESVPGFSQLPELPGPDDSMIMLGSRVSMGESQTQTIRDWVNQGGHLLTTAELYDFEERTSGDLLLDELGLIKRKFDNEPEPVEENNETGEEDDFGSEIFTLDYSEDCDIEFPEEALTSINFEGEQNKLYSRFPGNYDLEDVSGDSKFFAGTQEHTNLIQYGVGNGWITVFSHGQLWKNQHICQLDHAYLLWRFTKNTRKVWLLYDSGSPSLFELLWTHASWLLLSTLGLLFLSIWRGLLRLGPVVPDTLQKRRQLKEHLEASGYLFWRQKHISHLVHPLHDEIAERMELHHRGFARLSSQEKIRVLSEFTQLSLETVALAYQPMAEGKENLFLQTIQSLQMIRKKI